MVADLAGGELPPLTVRVYNTVDGIQRLVETLFAPNAGGTPEALRAVGGAGGPTTMMTATS